MSQNLRGKRVLWVAVALIILPSRWTAAAPVELAAESKLRAWYFAGSPAAKDAYQLDFTGRLTASYAYAPPTPDTATPDTATPDTATIAATWRAELAYELAAGYRGGAFQRLAAPQPRRYRADDLAIFAVDAPSGEFLAQNLDRAMLSYAASGSGLTVDIGRQPIAFGSGQMVNPTDVIAPKLLGALPSDIRAGVDGIRLRKLIGEMSQVDAGIVANGKAKDSAAFVTATLSLGVTELRPMIARFYEAWLLGFDAATTLAGAGLWWESAYVAPPKAQGASQGEDDGYLRSVLGAMRQLSPLSSASVEYYFNGAGRAEVADYGLAGRSFASRLGGSALLGRHYLGLAANLMVTPLLTYSQQLVANLGDSSAFLRAGIDYEVWPDSYLAVHLRKGFGPSPTSQGRPRSEFGRDAKLFYLALHSYY